MNFYDIKVNIRTKRLFKKGEYICPLENLFIDLSKNNTTKDHRAYNVIIDRHIDNQLWLKSKRTILKEELLKIYF